MEELKMQAEQKKFAEVKNFLNNEIERLGALIVENKEEIKKQGSEFNADNPNGGMYSGMELTEIHHEMEKKMADSKIAEDDIYFYKKLINSPYFARVDFKPENGIKERSVYIGLRTLQDPVTFKTYVCDWRAPIASLFYDEFTDKAYFDAPAGRIYGDLLLKRQYKFNKGELESFINCDIKIDDDILRDVLSNSSGESLKVIVNSIQREQNSVVRASDRENLLVIGPAGSGKTSVGFHRLAFLLYRNRVELSSSDIVMFSNSDIFSSYVADIIPELGEMPINYASFSGIFKAEIPDFKVENYYSLAEEVLKGDNEKLYASKEKTSKEFMSFLEKSVEGFKPKFKKISFYGFNILSEEELSRRYEESEGAPAVRGEAVAKFAEAVFGNFFNENEDEVSARIIDENSGSGEDEMRIIKREVREFKLSIAQMIMDVCSPNPVTTYFSELEKYAKKENKPYLTASKKSLREGVIEFSDALGIVFLKTVYKSSVCLSGVKHVLIDEAQDYSLIQHTIIRRMFPRAKFTVLADTNQAIIEGLNITDEKELSSIYSASIRRLNKSYRSTKQINSFALKLLPEEKRYDIFDRSGEETEEVSGDINKLKEIIKENLFLNKTFCLITKTELQAEKLYENIEKDFDGVGLCIDEGGNISSKIVVMPLAYSKGLEFDNVVIVNENGEFYGKENEKYLYLASTRALHRLTVFNLY